MDKRSIKVEYQQFEKSYGKIQAVQPLDLKIYSGETFALLGPNGSGKSTMIRSLAGLHYPTSGRILLDGKEITSSNVLHHKNIAYMPQRVTMPELLTAREILTLFAEIRGVNLKKIDEVLEFVALDNDADRYVREFSGGMLQRLGLATAFLEEVPLFVLDEPTLNLDSIGIERFRAKIHELKKKGVTIIFSSHILQDAAQLADRVGILSNGELVKVEKVPAFRAMISSEAKVRIVLEKTSDEIFAAANHAGAITTSYNGRHFTFKAPPKLRMNVIRAIETAGGNIEEFHTESPDWEALIQKSFKPGEI